MAVLRYITSDMFIMGFFTGALFVAVADTILDRLVR